MDFFTNPDILLGDKLLEILYIVMGLVLIYAGVRNLTDKTNPHRYGSAFFWTVLGVVIAGGRWLYTKKHSRLCLKNDRIAG